MEQRKGNEHEERCLVPMVFSSFFSYACYLFPLPVKKPPVFTGNINGPSWRVKDARLLLLSHCEVILFLAMTILADWTMFRTLMSGDSPFLHIARLQRDSQLKTTTLHTLKLVPTMETRLYTHYSILYSVLFVNYRVRPCWSCALQVQCVFKT